jgi:hypothetical protein
VRLAVRPQPSTDDEALQRFRLDVRAPLEPPRDQPGDRRLPGAGIPEMTSTARSRMRRGLRDRPRSSQGRQRRSSATITLGCARSHQGEHRVGFAELKRWLYRDNRPHALARFLNRGWATLHTLGIAPDHLVTLEVTGRRSGRTISFPLVMAKLDGERFLVSMLGADVAWVRNVKAAGGRARLRHGRTEDVRLEEIPVESRAPVLKAYLQRAPGARPHIAVDKDAPVEEFGAVATQTPVFRVVRAG